MAKIFIKKRVSSSFFEDIPFKYIYHVNYVFYQKSTWSTAEIGVWGHMLINPNFNYENESASIVDSFF